MPQPEPFRREASPHFLLIVAAWAGYEGAVRVLLELGADVSARDIGRATPLNGAELRGYEAVSVLLLAASAKQIMLAGSFRVVRRWQGKSGRAWKCGPSGKGPHNSVWLVWSRAVGAGTRSLCGVWLVWIVIKCEGAQ